MTSKLILIKLCRLEAKEREVELNGTDPATELPQDHRCRKKPNLLDQARASGEARHKTFTNWNSQYHAFG